MFYIGGTNMKLTKISVDNLHNVFDYTVNFNEDITFVYGENGCGKTTLLNIITSIISGEIYHLFELEFKSIVLEFVEELQVDKIIIKYIDNVIHINFEEEEYILERISIDESRRERIFDYYCDKYEFLRNIQKRFVSVYLPLNRKNSTNELNYRYDRFYRRSYIEDNSFFVDNQYDRFLDDVLEIIRNKYTEISGRINRIDENFKTKVINSVFKLTKNNDEDKDEILKWITNPKYISSLDKIKEDYLYACDNYSNIGLDDKSKIDTFFDSFKEDLEKFSNSEGENRSMSLDLVFKFKDLSKINKIIEFVQEREENISKTKEPINKYLNIVNSFISTKENGKKIKINPRGEIYLEQKKKSINVKNLSSGEKQIITFFAYIIFSLYGKSGIFVADEPELSLHLNWQRKFVESITTANPNLQIIFATHAPEIIGRFRNKAVKLEPNAR